MGNRNAFIPPRAGGGYPLDLDGSLRFTREATGTSIHPYPGVIGYIQGLLPLFDHQVMAGMFAKTAYGPWMGLPPVPSDPSLAFAGERVTAPAGLEKVEG